MNKKEIIQRLTNARLDPHERETLSQLLHYLHAEGLNSTSSSNNTNNTSSGKHPGVKGKKSRPRNTTSSNTR